MARAVIANIQKLVYEYLRVNTQGSYGTYLTNQRYPSAYIDDEIYSADLEIVRLLIKNNQDVLVQELQETVVLASGAALPNYHVINVVVTGATAGVRAIEVTEDQFNLLKDGGVIDSTTYFNYFAIFDGKIWTPSGAGVTVTYIELDRDTVIKAPESFEAVVADLAAARMLWNREDRPQQAQAHYQKAVAFMANYGIEMKGLQEMVDDKQ
jgi:hypothetical protein